MTNQSPLPDYNPDGSMNPHVRDRFRGRGLTEEEIDRIEEIKMRHIRIDRENAYWKEQHRKDGEEWERQYKAEQKEKERLGIKPTFKILYSSPDKINPNDMNPSQRRAYEMSGLSTEELLSQGYIDLDDLTHSGEKSEDDYPAPYKADPDVPDIPF